MMISLLLLPRGSPMIVDMYSKMLLLDINSLLLLDSYLACSLPTHLLCDGCFCMFEVSCSMVLLASYSCCLSLLFYCLSKLSSTICASLLSYYSKLRNGSKLSCKLSLSSETTSLGLYVIESNMYLKLSNDCFRR